jgi:DNA-binding beta-propeller fold protein YncE
MRIEKTIGSKGNNVYLDARIPYVNVFDLGTIQFVKQIRVSARPDVTATTLDGRYLYVAGEFLSIIDLETLNVIRKLTGEGIHAHYALNLFPDGQRMFLFNYDGSIVVLKNTHDPLQVSVEKSMVVNQPALPDAAVGGKGHFTADGQRYINANWHKNAIFSIDLANDYAIATLVSSGFDKPDDLVITADEPKDTAPVTLQLHHRRAQSTCLILSWAASRKQFWWDASPRG